MSETLGAFLNRVSSIATKIGAPTPSTDVPIGKDAALNVDRFNGDAFSSPGITPLPSERRQAE